jgi:hypothetical protein
MLTVNNGEETITSDLF